MERIEIITSTQRRRRYTGLGRESLYKALSGDVNPSFDTVIKVVKTLNLRLAI